MVKVVITLDLKTCKKCPHFEEKNGEYVSPDSFEGPNYDWFCKKENGRKIQGYVEWHEENKIPVPDWCPCLEKPNIENEVPKYKCLYCRDTGKTHYGGSFGGPIIVGTCPCGIANTLDVE